MAEFTLPKNSQIKKGRAHKSDGGKRPKSFKVYRYDPDSGANPRYDTYTIDLDKCGPMVLDALIKIRMRSTRTLTFRRSCREGFCGRARGTWAAKLPRLHHRDRRDEGRSAELPAAAHGKWSRTSSPTCPFLRAVRVDRAVAEVATPEPSGQGALPVAAVREKLDGTLRSILCACCSTSCPSYWWNSDKFLARGAARRLPLARRAAATKRPRTPRSARGPPSTLTAATPHELAPTCSPKGLNPAKAIAETKKMVAERRGVRSSAPAQAGALRD